MYRAVTLEQAGSFLSFFFEDASAKVEAFDPEKKKKNEVVFLESSLQYGPTLLDLYRYAGERSVCLKGSFIKSTQSPWHRKNVAHHVGAGPENLIYSVAEACPLSHTRDFLPFASLCMKITPGDC